MDAEKPKEEGAKKERKLDALNVILILTVVFGFIFRVVNANTRLLFGDPPHFILHSINFLNSGLLVVYDQSTFLWYAFTDIMFRVFGMSQLTSRFVSVFLGTLTIIAIYLFAKEFFNSRRVGIISAMLYAFMPIFIFNADDEHDIAMLFFIVAIFYCLIKGLKENSNKYLIFSGILFGVGCMWKAYLPILMFPYLGFVLYYHYKGRFNLKKNYKIFIWIFAIIVLLVSPTIVYNYLNYQHNQVTDLLFAKFFKVLNNKTEALYSWSGGGELYRTFEVRSPGDYLYWFKEFIFLHAPWLAIVGAISLLFLVLKRKEQPAKDYLVFYLLYFIVPFFFLVGSILMAKHYIHFVAFLIPAVAYFIDKIVSFISEKFSHLSNLARNHYFIAYLLIILILFFSIFSFSYGGGKELLFSSNPEHDLINYKISEIPDKALIIYDDRIYNCFAGWLFNDRYYIPISALNTFLEYNSKSSATESVPVYIVECATDDCGWGSISKNPELNKSIETFFSSLQNQSIKVIHTSKEKLTGPSYYNPLISASPELSDYYRVYKTYMNIDLNLAKQFKAQYSYFLYPLRYANPNDATFKNFIYIPQGLFESSINSLAWLIFYIDLLLSFIAMIFIVYEALNQKNDI